MGEDPKHLYKYLEFMLKKATLGRYKSEAFTGYDCCVREQAGLYRLMFSQRCRWRMWLRSFVQKICITRTNPWRRATLATARSQARHAWILMSQDALSKVVNTDIFVSCARSKVMATRTAISSNSENSEISEMTCKDLIILRWPW